MQLKKNIPLAAGIVLGAVLGAATGHLALGIGIGIAAAFLFTNLRKL